MVEQLVTTKAQVGPRCLGGIWMSRGSRGPWVVGGLEGWRNLGDQEKVEVVEQVFMMKLQVRPRCLGGIWESRGSRGPRVVGGLEEPR